MDYFTARNNLIKLLCVSLENISEDSLRKLVKKRYKLWHPDKNTDNPDRYRSQFMELNESYQRYMKGDHDSGTFSGTSGTFNSAEDLFCHEEWDPSWGQSSGEESDYNSTPFDDEFFNASPKKNFAVPDDLRLFFRSKTNRRAGKIFMLFTFSDSLHRKCIEELSKDDLIKSLMLFSARTNKDIYCTLIVTNLELRLLDLKKKCRKYSLQSIELFYAVNLYKLVDKLYELYVTCHYSHGESIERKTKEESNFNNKQLVDFALSHEYTEVFALMYEYAHLADPCDRVEFTKDHEDDHTNELLNAKKFVCLPDRKRVCKNAIDCVFAKLYRQLTGMSNLTWLEMRSRELSERLIECDDCSVFGEAYYYWKYVLGSTMFSEIMSFVISIFTDSLSAQSHTYGKRRFVALVGPYNCGKTSFSAAVCKFFDGVNINLNISKDRLPFYLGSAIGKRFVLFDDVKGYETKVKNLPLGTGISNLDDMREHLDGKIEVQLEKKNQNPVNQIFPQGILTMNMYKIPGSLKLRLKVVTFPPSMLYKRHRFKISMETIFIAMAMDNLIPCDPNFISHATVMKDKWLTQHRMSCTCLKVSMGGIISAIIAAGSALGAAAAYVGSAIAAGASAAGAAILSAAEYLGLLTASNVILDISLGAGEAIPLIEIGSGVAFAGVEAIEYTLTATGAYTLGFIATSALVGANVGLVQAIVSSGSKGAVPKSNPTPLIDTLSPSLLCLIDNDYSRLYCRGVGQHQVRVQNRKGRKQTVLSDVEEGSPDRRPQKSLRSVYKTAPSRKVSVKAQSMRRTRRK